MMQQFFLSFWRNQDVAQPQAAWEKYKLEVIKVNSSFSTSIKRGYLSENKNKGLNNLWTIPP